MVIKQGKATDGSSQQVFTEAVVLSMKHVTSSLFLSRLELI